MLFYKDTIDSQAKTSNRSRLMSSVFLRITDRCFKSNNSAIKKRVGKYFPRGDRQDYCDRVFKMTFADKIYLIKEAKRLLFEED